MKNLAISIFIFFLFLSVLIYFNKNFQYEKYLFIKKSQEKKQYLININLGTWYDFASLPGISDNLAKEILRNREENGRFNSVDELRRVNGIGEKKLKAIKQYLTLEV